MKIAILDDYFSRAHSYADWESSDDLSVTFFDSHVSDTRELIEMLMPFEAVGLMRERTPFPKQIIDALPNLKLIVTSGMRNAAIDLDAAKARGVLVCGTTSPGHATAELAFMLVMMLCRKVIPLVNGLKKDNIWQPVMGHDVRGKTLGIVGLGRLGTYVAKLGKAFGMEVIAWSENLKMAHAEENGALAVTKDELLARSDFITIHYILSERSKDLIKYEDLCKMKKTAFLVNTSRGPIINEDDLVRALQEEKIAGAGIDVYTHEPLPENHKLRFLPNAFLTPHIGYVTFENYSKFYTQMAENLQAFIDGKPIRILN